MENAYKSTQISRQTRPDKNKDTEKDRETHSYGQTHTETDRKRSNRHIYPDHQTNTYRQADGHAAGQRRDNETRHLQSAFLSLFSRSHTDDPNCPSPEHVSKPSY